MDEAYSEHLRLKINKKVKMVNQEPTAKSHGQDQREGRGRGEDQDQKATLEESHVRLDKHYSFVFFCCRVLGLHVVTRNKKGDYVLSVLSLAPALVMSAFATVCLGGMVKTMTTPLPLWFSVVLFSEECAYVFCLFLYAQTCWNAGRMRRYMAAIPRVKVQKSRCTRAGASAVLYPLLVSFVLCFLLPEWKWVSPSFFITTAIPAFHDAYLNCFSRPLKDALEDLGLEVRRRDLWRPSDVSDVSRRWVALTQLLQGHNKVCDARA